MENIVPTSLVKPFLDYIDNGNFFRQPVKILYMIIAVLNALVPFYALYRIIESGMLRFASGGVIVALILAWLILLAGFLWVALIWLTRAGQFNTMGREGDEYPVTPVFAHFVRTGGEAMGIIIGVICFLISLVVLVFAGSQGRGLLSMSGLNLASSWGSVFLLPIVGFLTIVISRFFSEQIRALVNIAQNTKK